MSRPRLLDLFCGAGGAAMGYARAGFDVVGVDINPQPRYPFESHQADALTVLKWLAAPQWARDVDAIHASPPCQGYSTTASLHDNEYPKLIGEVRALLTYIGVPYVIENVPGAPLLNPVRLCGSSFGLGVRRHRLFETSWPVGFAPPCAHYLQPEPVDVTGTGGRRTDPQKKTSRKHRDGDSPKPRNLAHAREVMGIDWMARNELDQAIPPAYTAWLGAQLLDHLRERAA